MNKIDINCDLGEGMGNDELLMPYLDSCNIACGGHFGNEETIIQTIKLAKKHNTKVGAHPSFPDPENFGRKIMDISRAQLTASLLSQINTFQLACQNQNVKMHHIKLHGALYNLAAKDLEIAALVLNVFAAVKHEITIYVPYGSVIATLAEDYFPICYEAFIDRQYHSDLSLVSRDIKGALISDNEMAWQQLNSIMQNQQVPTKEGELIHIKANTYCLHGDGKNALQMLKHIRKCLKK